MSGETLQGSNIAVLKGMGKSETQVDRIFAEANIGGFARALLAYHVREIAKDPNSTRDTIPDLFENIERVILSITGDTRFINPINGRILHYQLDTVSNTLTARYMPIDHIRFTDGMIAIYPQALPAAVMNRLLAEGPRRDEHGSSTTKLSDIIDISLPGYNPIITDIGRDQMQPLSGLILSTSRNTHPWMETRMEIISRRGEINAR